MASGGTPAQGVQFTFDIDFSQPLKAIRVALDDIRGAAVDSLKPLVNPVNRAILQRMPSKSGRMKQSLFVREARGRKPGFVFVVASSRASGYRISRGHEVRAIFIDGGTIDGRKKRKSSAPTKRTSGGIKPEKFMIRGKNAAAPPRKVKQVVELGLAKYMRKSGFVVT